MVSERTGQRSIQSSGSTVSTGKVHIPRELKERDVLIISGILIIAVFFIDISLAIGYVVSMLYVIPILICIWTPKRRAMFLVTGIASVLTLIAVFYKPPGDIFIPLFNRPVSLLMIWTVAIIIDMFVTERKKAEKTQREIQEDLNYAQLVSRTGSWRVNVKTNELLWSDETYRIFGVPLGKSMTYDTFLSLIHPGDRENVDREWKEAIKGRPYEVEHRIVVDGKVKWVREKAVLEMDRDGVLIGGFGTVQDITDRKKASEDLLNSQQMLQLVLDNIPQRVLWKGLDLKYLGANRIAALDAGLSDPKEIVGKTDHELAWRLSAEFFRADDMEVIATGRAKLNFEDLQVRSDGRIMRLMFSKVPLRDARGDIIGILGTYEDITAQKMLEFELKRSNAELQQFAYVASHDLQEPLRMIISYLTLLDRRYKNDLDPQAQEYIQTAVEGGMRMRALIDDLLEYSRIDTMAKPFVPVNMNELLRNVMNNLRASIEESKAEISVEPLPIIMADETQITQVLQNLIANAIKFHGTESPRVLVSATQDDKEWTIAVKDNGIGMDPMYADKIFHMFQRLHSRDKYPGTGVGLAITKKIVERHGGRIWVRSEDGKGATFYFTVPKVRGMRIEPGPLT